MTVPIKSSVTLSTQDGKGLPIPARRVISLYGSFNEILLALGARDVIVARTAADGHLPELAELPAIGTHMQPNAELIVAQKPDVILQMKGRRETGSQTEHLRELGIPVLTFELNSLEDLYSVTLTLGRLVGREVEATNLVGQWRRRLAALRNSYATEPAVRVFFEAGSPNLLAAGKGNIVNDLINAAGGINVVESPRKLVRLNEEAVIAFTAAIEIDEKKPEAYISLAEVYQAQEDWENALAALQQGQESCGESEELTAAREELEQILSQQGLVIEENGQIGWAVDPDELMQQLPGELQDYFYLTSAQREERLRPLIPLLQELAAQDDKGSGESWALRLCDVYHVLGETEQLQQLRAELLEITDARDKEYAYGPEGGERVDENGGRVTTERTDGSGNMVYYESVSSKEDGSSSSSIKEYEYGGDGRRERSTANSEDYYGGYRANGTHSHESTTVITYEYDGEGRLSGTTKERTYVEVTRTGTSTGTTIERSEYSYGT